MSVRDLWTRLRDAVIAYVPSDPPAQPVVSAREPEPPPQPQPIPPEWARKNASVSLEGLSPMMRSVLPKLAEARRHALRECLDAPMVVTSGAEGKAGDGVHAFGSLHYRGEAADLRIVDYPQIFARHAAHLLGPEYDVIVEDLERHRCSRCGQVDALAAHLHAEYDP